MSIDIRNSSIVQFFDDQEQHRCGYCKNPRGSISYGMMAEQLTVEDYKNLIDRGWRRSGKYCYKPTMSETCCPQYTIKCDALDFRLNKSHKKIIKKFNKFLKDGVYTKNTSIGDANSEFVSELFGVGREAGIDISQLNNREHVIEESTILVNCGKIPEKQAQKNISNENQSQFGLIQENTEKISKYKALVKNGCGADPNKPPCKKAKLLRLERKKEQVKNNLQNHSTRDENKQKSLHEFLNDISSTAKHQSKIELIPVSICDDRWERVKNLEYQLYKKYQNVVHNESLDKLSMESFKRFLVSSPLQPKPFPGSIEGPGYGSFHQQYWIDDKLIAVGVIDILPGCLSSVYFFYDPDYRNLTLGTYGSLREIEFVQELCLKIPDLKYYYMGYYIHSCPKMRYKGKLSPSHLLCPETYVWQPLDRCLPKLEVAKYSRLNEDPQAKDPNACDNDDINHIQLIYNFKLFDVQTYLMIKKDEEAVFTNISKLVGKKCVHKLLFWM